MQLKVQLFFHVLNSTTIFLMSYLMEEVYSSNKIPISFKLDAWSQYDNPEEGTEREGDIRKRPVSRKTTTRDQTLLWPNGIVPYYLDKSILEAPEVLPVLKEAMEDIMDKTCVRFKRIYSNEYGELSKCMWLNITGNQKGCFSDLGRNILGPSEMNLNVKRCFRTKGHAIHELLHILGVYHEHMRPDRDQYIKIIWENVKPGDEYNFKLLDNTVVTTYGLPYDYDSIMHYSMTSFSKNKSLPTIIPLKPNVKIGQRNYLSFYDIQKLLITYKCNEVNTDILYDEMFDKHGNDHSSIKLNKISDAIKRHRQKINYAFYDDIKTYYDSTYDYTPYSEDFADSDYYYNLEK